MPRKRAARGEKGIPRRIERRCDSPGAFENRAFWGSCRAAQCGLPSGGLGEGGQKGNWDGWKSQASGAMVRHLKLVHWE